MRPKRIPAKDWAFWIRDTFRPLPAWYENEGIDLNNELNLAYEFEMQAGAEEFFDYLFGIEHHNYYALEHVQGIQSFTLNPGGDIDTDDVTDFDADGMTEEVVMRRMGSLTLAGKKRPVADTTLRNFDQGQEVSERHGRVANELDLPDFEIVTPMGYSIVGECTVSVDSNDGDDAELTNWSAEWTFHGRPEKE